MHELLRGLNSGPRTSSDELRNLSWIAVSTHLWVEPQNKARRQESNVPACTKAAPRPAQSSEQRSRGSDVGGGSRRARGGRRALREGGGELHAGAGTQIVPMGNRCGPNLSPFRHGAWILAAISDELLAAAAAPRLGASERRDHRHRMLGKGGKGRGSGGEGRMPQFDHVGRGMYGRTDCTLSKFGHADLCIAEYDRVPVSHADDPGSSRVRPVLRFYFFLRH